MTGYESHDLINKLNASCHAAEGSLCSLTLWFQTTIQKRLDQCRSIDKLPRKATPSCSLCKVLLNNVNSHFREVWCRRGKLYFDG